MNGDLFLVRHLLILREQLIPFEIRLHTVERQLDWSGTKVALNNLLHNTRMMLRMDTGNAFLQLALEGTPDLQETEIDAKRDLDNVLKTSCSSLKQNAIKLLLGPLDAFLAKVTAFVGEIPMSNFNEQRAPEDQQKVTTNASFQSLKSQSFVRPERIKEMLDNAITAVQQSTPELRSAMQLYVENAVSRAILLKPIQQETEQCKRKMETILEACIDPGEPQKELGALLASIFAVIVSELTH